MFNKTVDSITKVFTQAIKDLEALQVTLVDDNLKQDAIIKKAADVSNKNLQELARAKAVREKLLSIVSN